MPRFTRRTEMVGLASHFTDELPHGQERRPIIRVGKMFAGHPRLELRVHQARVHPTTARRTTSGLEDEARADSVVAHVEAVAKFHSVNFPTNIGR